ncbi:DNase I-like protein [Cristinia sonorae]|uniref:DNase I-like protein n=1 Tax=Cristinia sonorae TaxID=1940300 RepID=A0A8K0XR37_9AGAR|nr:DNase I-like protein [Cristinia sonorae]
MAQLFEDAIHEYLRPSEEFKLALDVRLPPEESSDEDASQKYVWDSVEKQRYLAVITHLDATTGDEQGCVFIFRRKIKRTPSSTDTFLLEDVFPILGRFTISMAQPRRSTLDLGAPPDLSLNQPRTELTLTIEPGHEAGRDARVVLLTRDIVKLREVLAECRRLRDLSAANSPNTIPPYGWLVPYTYTEEPTILSPIPSDLRTLRKPLHEHLSPASAGQPGDDAFDISLIREEWIKREVHDQHANAKETFTLRLRLGTFNVNGKLPSQDLSPWVRGRSDGHPVIPPLQDISPLSMGEWLKFSGDYLDGASSASSVATSASGSTVISTPSAKTAGTAVEQASGFASHLNHDDRHNPIPDPDLLVLAFQELDLSTEALLYSTKATREEAWCAAALAGLGEKAVGYEKLASKQLVGMLLVIIVKKSLKACFGDVKTTSVGAGILGLMGNKGGTAVRLAFTPPATADASSPQPVIITFVNAHLAAFDEMFERRNADFHDLSKRLQFDYGIPAQNGPVEEDGHPLVTVPLSVYQTDALFWMHSDLNYRINLADADIRALLSDASESHGLPVLTKFDQLGLAMRTKKAFTDFEEPYIHYPPSYRFASGVLTDDRGYDMKRKPAWTDRILHMSSPTVQIKSHAYSSHVELTMSDHKPVSADFSLRAPVLESEKIESYIRSIWREVLNIEHSEENPKLQVTPLTVDFGPIYHKQTTTRTLELKNIGQIPCAYRFVPISSEAPIHPDWLRIEPFTGLLLPGETASVSLITVTDDGVVGRLNSGPSRLNDTLILHTLLGKDHFISTTAQYRRTCFATSLDHLVRLPGPVRSSDDKIELLPEDQALNAPREVMRLVNWLMSHATNIPGLFLSPGDQDLVAEIRECLDTGTEFSPHAEEGGARMALAFATCLLEFLDSLPESVIPSSMHPRCAQVTDREQAFELLDDLPSASVNVWISVTAFLHFITQQARGVSDTPVTSIFASVLLRDELTTPTPVSPVGKQRFVRYFVG